MYDILIKGGKVVDPAQGISDERDIGISQGKIAALSDRIHAAEAKRIINAHGKIVTTGLIDLHTHVAHGVIDIALHPDDCGVHSGTTAICDAGSTGYMNFQNFKDNIITNSVTDVFCFLNVVPDGLAVMPEVWDLSTVNPQAMLRTIDENRDIIKGIKIRATGAMVQSFGLKGLKVAKQIADEADLRLMIHLGADPDETVSEEEMNRFTPDMLNVLDEGDMLTHIYTWKRGRVINPDGTMFPELKDAMTRGVLLDVANARTHYSVEIAKIALDQGIAPFTMSTDLTNVSINEYVFSLVVTMSKFLAIGVDFQELIKMATMNPTTVLGDEENRGSLRLGMPADVSILELQKGDYVFHDGIEGQTFKGDTLIAPILTLRSGTEISAESRFPVD
jgi:dihydroorotase